MYSRWQVDHATYSKFLLNRGAAIKHGIPGSERIKANLGNSVNVQNWNPATIVMQYDGGINSKVHRIDVSEHQKIMTNIFSTPSVRCVFSTKLNRSLFERHFCIEGSPVKRSEWRVRSFSFSFQFSWFVVCAV